MGRLTYNTCLVTVVILHHILNMLSWSNESLNWYIFAFGKRNQIDSLLSIA
jgi:hypothetical protein